VKLIRSIPLPAWVAGFKVITWRCEHCRRSSILRNLSVRNTGIRMHGSWYCGARCFTAAAAKEKSQLLTSGADHANHQERMPLGLFLVSRGLLSGEQLREATTEQKETPGDIGELLIRHGAVTEKQVTASRAEQWGCPVFAVPKQGLSSVIHIPPTLIQLYFIVPLHYVAATNLLLVGFVHGIDYGLLYAIERITGCKTQACFVTPGDFEAQIEAQRKQHAQEKDREAHPKEVKFDRVQPAAEMARDLCRVALETEADEAVMGRSKDYLWVRLKRGPKAVDLLFKTG
jgi:hypothetical protein